MDENLVWNIRAFVYRHFVETTHPPRIDEAASRFGITLEQAAEAYKELGRRHALYLAPGTHNVQMAWPFSGLETSFKVFANGKTYFANCAWDALGIPVAIQADAEIEAACAQSGELIHLTVRGRQVRGPDALVHFLVPFREWYDDLTFTWGTMLFFRSEEQLDQWLAVKQMERGAVLSIPRLWHLSQRWYRDRTSPNFRGRTMEEVQQIFEDEGLTTEYWRAT